MVYVIILLVFSAITKALMDLSADGKLGSKYNKGGFLEK